MSEKSEQVRLVSQSRFQLHLEWQFLLFSLDDHHLLGLVEAEQVASGEDDAVEHSHGEVTVLGVACAKPTDEWHGDDVDNTYRHHRTDRTAGVETGSLVDVLGHGSAEGAVRQIDASVA